MGNNVSLRTLSCLSTKVLSLHKRACKHNAEFGWRKDMGQRQWAEGDVIGLACDLTAGRRRILAIVNGIAAPVPPDLSASAVDTLPW